MKRIEWKTYAPEIHDDKAAKRLRKLLLKGYKYAAKHGLWEVRMVVTNDSSEGVDCLEDECYAEVSAWYYDANVVHDATSLPIIEESV